MLTKNVFKSAALGMLLFSSATASAATLAHVPADTLRVVEYVPPSHVFGQQGQILLGGSSTLNLNGVYAKSENRTSGPFLTLSPQASVFVAKHLALGLTGSLGVARDDHNHSSVSLAVGPLVTASIPLSERTSFLPSAAPVYTRSNGHDAAAMQMNLDFALHASNHLLLTFGPYVNQDMYSSNNQSGLDTVFGVKAGVLGWL